MTAEVRAEPGASGLCPGEWRTARVGVEPGEGWETQPATRTGRSPSVSPNFSTCEITGLDTVWVFSHTVSTFCHLIAIKTKRTSA